MPPQSADFVGSDSAGCGHPALRPNIGLPQNKMGIPTSPVCGLVPRNDPFGVAAYRICTTALAANSPVMTHMVGETLLIFPESTLKIT